MQPIDYYGFSLSYVLSTMRYEENYGNPNLAIKVIGTHVYLIDDEQELR